MNRCILSCVLMFSCLGILGAQDVPKADLFFGYSFLRYNSAQTIPAFTANGGIGTFAWNFNNHFAFEAELGGYHNGNVNNYHFDSTTFSYLFGPRLSVGRSKTFDPYIHVLFGGQHATSSIASSSVLITNPLLETGTTAPERFKASTNAFAMAAGGGIDIKLSRLITLRPAQIDYYLTRFEVPDVTLPPGSTNPRARNQNNFRYAAGIAFNFGGESAGPPPPPRVTTQTCPDGSTIPTDQTCPKRNITLGLNASQSEVCAGAVVKLTPAAPLPDGAMMQWSVNNEATSQATEFDFGTNGRAPGRYRIGLKVGAEGYNDASAETVVTVRGYQAPTGSVQASPAEIFVGDKSTISPNFRAGQCGGPLQPAVLSASEGSISGSEFDSTTVAFDPSNNAEQRKTVTIAAKVSDPGGSASADTQVIVKKRAELTAKRLPDVVFPVNSSRVNNCGKRVLLEELKTYTDSDTTATVYFVGHRTEKEAAELDAKRAMNAAAVISAGSGICTAFPASQIFAASAGTDQTADFQPRFCGTSAETAERSGQSIKEGDESAKLRRVEVWLVPTNAKPPALSQQAKDAASAGVASLGCPR